MLMFLIGRWSSFLAVDNFFCGYWSLVNGFFCCSVLDFVFLLFESSYYYANMLMC